MGTNPGSTFRQELANLERVSYTHKTRMRNLKSIVKDLDSEVIHLFISQLSEIQEIGSESSGYTVSLFQDLATAHGIKIAPYVELIIPVIIRTLSSSKGSLSVQQACSKAVATIASYGIDLEMSGDKKRYLIHSLCKPLCDSLLDSQYQQNLALGSSLCLKSLVDCENWRFASDEMVDKVVQSLAVALEATSYEADSHMELVIALAKKNPLTVEVYAKFLVKSGLRILNLDVLEGDSQRKLLAIQMINFLMKNLDSKRSCYELEVIFQEMKKHQKDQMHFVKIAAYETMRTAERLIGETRVLVRGSDEESYVNDQEDEDILFSGVTCVSGSPLVTDDDYIQETGSVLDSPGSIKHDRHSFTKDPFIEKLKNIQQLQQYSESSSSSTICDLFDTTSTKTTECNYEKPKSDLDSEVKVKTGVAETDSRRKMRKRIFRCVLGFLIIAVAGFDYYMWVHLQDDMMPYHLVPT